MNAAGGMLVLSPHPDDALLGAGGTMLRYIASGSPVSVLVASAHQPPLFSTEIFQGSMAESEAAYAAMGVERFEFLGHAALSLAQIGSELNRSIEDMLRAVQPAVFLIPFRDSNVDHQVLFDSSLVAARAFALEHPPAIVAAYEVVGSSHLPGPPIGPGFRPDWFVDITDHIQTKLDRSADCVVQMRPYPHPRSVEAVRALAQFRGSQRKSPYGEAFQIVQLMSPPEIFHT